MTDPRYWQQFRKTASFKKWEKTGEVGGLIEVCAALHCPSDAGNCKYLQRRALARRFPADTQGVPDIAEFFQAIHDQLPRVYREWAERPRAAGVERGGEMQPNWNVITERGARDIVPEFDLHMIQVSAIKTMSREAAIEAAERIARLSAVGGDTYTLMAELVEARRGFYWVS